jgi:hypothetical protein
MLSFFSNRNKICFDKIESIIDSKMDVLIEVKIGKMIEFYVNRCLIQNGLSNQIANLEARLKRLEDLVNIPHTKPEASSPNIELPRITATNAILDIIKKEKNELSVDEVFKKIKKYNLKNPGIIKESIRPILYALKRQGKIDYGKQKGTFKGIS